MDMQETCIEQEKDLVFDTFSHSDALKLGLLIEKNAAKQPIGVAIAITFAGMTVFQYAQDGAVPDNLLWLARKQRTVELMRMSSLHFKLLLEKNGETLTDRKLDPTQYVNCGGGFPLTIRGSGVVGTICVSGLDDVDDHLLVTDSIRQFLGQ